MKEITITETGKKLKQRQNRKAVWICVKSGSRQDKQIYLAKKKVIKP